MGDQENFTNSGVSHFTFIIWLPWSPYEGFDCSVLFLESSLSSVHISFIKCKYFSLVVSFFIDCKPLMKPKGESA